jgi:predicted transcriptional regulator of viral defense system
MTGRRRSSPSWDALFAIADAHDGYFSTRQAAEAGFSPQLLQKHIKAGRVEHTMRGVYRLVHYPGSTHENLSPVWLWSNEECIFSHQTALWLHGLSEILPHKVYITLPTSWRARRVRLPTGVIASYGDLPAGDWSMAGAVPITTPKRTLLDCSRRHLSPEFLIQAVEDAVGRGLIASDAIDPEVSRALGPYRAPVT